ncbi:unnamed protein product [Lymnaea stagnalis]|uniref:Beta-galactosidase n=1 Tax=Lymnaea stagnalis TaxID=6523 RepID=A0AAV2HN81_LYMST
MAAFVEGKETKYYSSMYTTFISCENMRRKTILRLGIVIFITTLIWVVWFATHLDDDGHQFPLDYQDEVFLNGKNMGPLSPDLILQNQRRKKFQMSYVLQNAGNKTVPLPRDFKSLTIPVIKENKSFNQTVSENDMTLAEGLTFHNRVFYLNRKPFRIFSGAVHYFRIIPEQWEDRLLKLKSCGLNTVETYAPWNLHEPSPGVYNFDGILNLRKFITMAADLGLFVILRPGPYICSEFDFGGLPGWLLSDPDMKVRSNYPGYVSAVNKYWSVLLPLVFDLQFTEGGPIIMFQVENELTGYTGDTAHLKLLVYLMKSLKVKELIVTSDHKFKEKFEVNRNIDFSQYALLTDNLGSFNENSYDVITTLNPHFPYMVMELWTGWFDYWGQKQHSQTSPAGLQVTLNSILTVGGSFNLYMFIGGTNFGFTSGANNFSSYMPMVTSYDYDAILTESGDITPKYEVVRETMLNFYKTIGVSGLPFVPRELRKGHYGSVLIQKVMEWDIFISLIPIAATDDKLNYMETYRDHDNRHTTLGYIVYSYDIGEDTHWNKMPGIQMTGEYKDRLTAILNSEIFYVQDDLKSDEEDKFLPYNWDQKFQNVSSRMKKRGNKLTRRLDLMVENLGRVNFSPEMSDHFNDQRKGLRGPVFRYIFGIMENWNIRYLTFDQNQYKILTKSMTWESVEDVEKRRKDVEETDVLAPALYKTYLTISNEPLDTFLRLDGWTKGVVLINGFNLGRYWFIGPQRTLYVPGPLLVLGQNEIMIFEEIKRGADIYFQDKPSLG